MRPPSMPRRPSRCEAVPRLYHDVPVLPPDQYTSLVLAATDGCRYNQCTFCGLYRDVRFRRRSADEFRDHVRAALDYHGAGLTLRRTVFLGQADALLGPRDWREEVLRIVATACQFPPLDSPRVRPPGGRDRARGSLGSLHFWTRLRARAFRPMSSPRCGNSI